LSAVIFDRNAAAQCLAAYRQLYSTCSNTSNPLDFDWDACARVTTGTRPVGSSCPTGLECAPGLGCAFSHPNNICTAKCEPVAMLGQKCDSAGCVDGSWCNYSTGVCESQRRSGQSCLNSLGCKKGLFCFGSAGMSI